MVTLKTERHHHNSSAHAAFNACIGHVHGLSYGRRWTFTTTTAPTLPRLRYHLNLVFNTISRALEVRVSVRYHFEGERNPGNALWCALQYYCR
jgi:hypothetical protein